MKDILSACQPRPEILSGQFNPEMFKASLSRVLGDYDRGRAEEGADSIYSDPVAFFRDATFPTQGLKDVVSRALGRLVAGDLSFTTLQRLDTAFGGGKTHTLIALTHIARRGRDLGELTRDIVPGEYLPETGSIRIVGIIGDTVDTLREERDENGNPKPNTLWWLIAKQTFSESERAPIASRLESPSAPASDEFFDALLGAQPTLIIIDEIAQYLARMEAAFPGVGSEQAAAFLMSLTTYAEDRANIAVVISLASATNAFGGFNTLIRTLKTTHDMSDTEARDIASGAQENVLSVLNRSSDATTPVQQGDLSKIMAKRLFVSVDTQAAEEVADSFIETYRLAGTDLPVGANDPELRDKLIGHYPFHPTLISYLSEELAQVETFQGTRGLLRTLARAIRRIWEAELHIPLIQTGHLDLSDSYIRGELLGTTENTDLIPVLDSDVTKPADSETVGRTVAGSLDTQNPHPEGLPVHEWAWRVVFLKSLVGRDAGLQDEKFGVDMSAAVYAMASPSIKPATVRSALDQIAREANYLRERDGRLYADTAPTLNNILRRIEGGVQDDKAIDRVEQVVRELIRSENFDVHAAITESESIPDQVQRPQLGVLSFTVDKFDPAAFVEKRGDAPRRCQNLVFLLAPSTAHAAGTTWSEQRTQQERRRRDGILALARKAIAVEQLKANPEAWGVSSEQLQKGEFKESRTKIPQELRTAVEECYRYLLYPGKDGGRIVNRDIQKRGAGPAAGGSGGLHLQDAIWNQLAEDGELITGAKAAETETHAMLNRLFFRASQQVDTSKIARNFSQIREWPVLERPELLGDLLRHGAERGAWCLGKMPDRNAHKPENLYHRDAAPPITIEPQGDDWIVCTKEHAKKLSWLEDIVRDPNKIGEWTLATVETLEEGKPDEVRRSVEEKHDRIDPNIFENQIIQLLATSKLVGFPDSAFDENGKPDPNEAVFGEKAPLGGTSEISSLKLVPMRIAQEREWIVAPKVEERSFSLEDAGHIKQVLNLLAGTALQESKTQIIGLQIIGTMRSDDSRFNTTFGATEVGQLAKARDLFSAIATRVKFDGAQGRLHIVVGTAEEGCRFVNALESLKGTYQ